MEKTFQYTSEIQSIPLIRKDLEELARDWDLPGSELRQIILIVEELFSNTIRFAFNDESEHRIEMRISMNGGMVSIEMIDDGIPFNPMDYNPSLHSDPAAQDDGGMGLTLVKTFADSIEYRREDPRNHLVIQKIIRSTPDPDTP
jgi:serine/threonine-protein kinase RsbW